MAGWPLLSGFGANGFVSVDGSAPGDRLAYFLDVSPGWFATMKMPLIDGRDFRPDDVYPGAAIVNEAFAREYFHGANPVGRSFSRGTTRLAVAGLVREDRYRNMREPITPTAYVPFQLAGPEATVNHATFLVRTLGQNPLSLAGILRRAVTRARSEFRVSNLRTQTAINQSQTLRERLLATLALFFAAVALLLAGIGLYGVFNYSVLQRRREIGIRIAVGASPANIMRCVVSGIFAMVLAGGLAGIGLGLAAARYIDTLLYHVEPAAPGAVLLPSLVIVAAAVVASITPVLRAVRLDPVTILRVE